MIPAVVLRHFVSIRRRPGKHAAATRSISILPPGFWNADVATKDDQSNRRDRCGQSKDEPHRPRAPRTVLGKKPSQKPSPRSDKDLANEEWKVRERAVRCFLPFRCNCGGILIDSPGGGKQPRTREREKRSTHE